MAHKVCGHLRESLAEAGLTLIEKRKKEIAVKNDCGIFELWAESPMHAGYSILVNDKEYEYVRSANSIKNL